MTLDMQATAISEHSDRIIEAANKEEFLPISVIYGPNGGGKSNVLKAMNALRSKVLRPFVCNSIRYNNEGGKYGQFIIHSNYK